MAASLEILVRDVHKSFWRQNILPQYGNAFLTDVQHNLLWIDLDRVCSHGKFTVAASTVALFWIIYCTDIVLLTN